MIFFAVRQIGRPAPAGRATYKKSARLRQGEPGTSWRHMAYVGLEFSFDNLAQHVRNVESGGTHLLGDEAGLRHTRRGVDF